MEEKKLDSEIFFRESTEIKEKYQEEAKSKGWGENLSAFIRHIVRRNYKKAMNRDEV